MRRSYVSATHVDCSGAAAGGLVAANGSVVAFSGSIASGCTGAGITSSASFVAFEQGIAINNATYNLYAEDGGHVEDYGEDVEDSLEKTRSGVRRMLGEPVSGRCGRRSSPFSSER